MVALNKLLHMADLELTHMLRPLIIKAVVFKASTRLNCHFGKANDSFSIGLEKKL